MLSAGATGTGILSCASQAASSRNNAIATSRAFLKLNNIAGKKITSAYPSNSVNGMNSRMSPEAIAVWGGIITRP